jgi:hypothetical protein
MRGHEEFSLASARRAAADDALEEWVTAFLASPGSDNEALAAALALDGTTYLGPLEFELDRLTPMAGPDEDEVVVPIDPEEWEDDVGAMAEAIDEGWEPPPLLVSCRDGEFFLEDGNHRHETLTRAGATHAWAILFFTSEGERSEFVELSG